MIHFLSKGASHFFILIIQTIKLSFTELIMASDTTPDSGFIKIKFNVYLLRAYYVQSISLTTVKLLIRYHIWKENTIGYSTGNKN